MSTAAPTQPKLAIYSFFEKEIGAGSQAVFTAGENGLGTLTGLPVFKAGTFTDSFGFTETYTREHLAQMAAHFSILRPVFPNVPVRADHTRSIDRVKGYFTNVYVEGEFLLGDIEFTEPDAVEKWSRGTYRSRSAEIGIYDTNDGAMYYPVLLGVAFVDIPAVEGLFSKDIGGNSTEPPVRYFTEASPNMTTGSTAQATTDTAPALRPGEGGAAAVTLQFGAPGSNVTITSNSAAGAAPAAEAKPDEAPATFNFGGKLMTGAEIEAALARAAQIETAQKEMAAAARANFAKGLVDANKLGAPQLDAMAELAKSLDDDQFAKLQAVYDAAPVLSILASHADGISNADGRKGEPTDQERELARLEGIVRFQRQAGMDEASIRETDSYKQLTALKGAGK